MAQFQSEANGLDLYTDALWLCGLLSTDTTSYPIKDFTRNANFGLDKFLSIVLQADGDWRHDDTVQTTEILDLTIALVSGTKKYAIPVTWLKVGSPVRVKDSAGNWNTIAYKDRNRLSDAELAATGIPTTYHRIGNWMYLSPTPNFSQAASLEVPFQRAQSYFVYTDTTKTPGFATHFHRYISLFAALDYCKVNDLDKRVASITKDMEKMEGEIKEHYSARNEDEQPNLNIERDDYGQGSLASDAFDSNPKGF